MSTNTLLETIFSTLKNETIGKYKAQSVKEIDILYTNKATYSNFINSPKFNTEENRNEFLGLFQAINSAEEIPETMLAITTFVTSLATQKS